MKIGLDPEGDLFFYSLNALLSGVLVEEEFWRTVAKPRQNGA